MSGSLNGAAWRGEAYASVYRGEFFVGTTRDRSEHHVGASAAISGPGVYDVKPGSGRYYETLGGDAVAYAAEATGGTVEIAEYDERSGVARGTLRLAAKGSRGPAVFEGDFLVNVRVVP